MVHASTIDTVADETMLSVAEHGGLSIRQALIRDQDANRTPLDGSKWRDKLSRKKMEGRRGGGQ